MTRHILDCRSWSSSNRILSASGDGKIGIWSTDAASAPAAPSTLLPSALGSKRRKTGHPTSTSTPQRRTSLSHISTHLPRQFHHLQPARSHGGIYRLRRPHSQDFRPYYLHIGGYTHDDARFEIPDCLTWYQFAATSSRDNGSTDLHSWTPECRPRIRK